MISVIVENMRTIKIVDVFAIIYLYIYSEKIKMNLHCFCRNGVAALKCLTVNTTISPVKLTDITNSKLHSKKSKTKQKCCLLMTILVESLIQFKVYEQYSKKYS